jgi:hypothetical protein
MGKYCSMGKTIGGLYDDGKKEGNMPTSLLVALHSSDRITQNPHQLKVVTYDGSIFSETPEGSSIF